MTMPPGYYAKPYQHQYDDDGRADDGMVRLPCGDLITLADLSVALAAADAALRLHGLCLRCSPGEVLWDHVTFKIDRDVHSQPKDGSCIDDKDSAP